MNRTITALYDTKAAAERVRDALTAAHLGDHVRLRDRDGDEAKGHGGLSGWLGNVFGGHEDSSLYAEGLRRGHVLLTAKVDDLNETRAAEIMDASAPVDLRGAEQSWRGEGWTPTPTGRSAGESITGEAAREASPMGLSVRIYTLST